ncbi:hypothetical protein DSECCO2_251490 [anaerobic digester metagenome]
MLLQIHENIEDIFSVLSGAVHELLQRGISDGPLGHIDNSPQGDFIEGIVDQPKVAHNVLDLFAIIELQSPDDPIRNRMAHKAFFKDTRLSVGPIQNREFMVIPSVPHQPFDFL